MVKTCKRCQETKEVSEFRLVGKWYQTYCKQCENLNKCERSKKNRTLVTETARKYRQEHLPEHRAAQKKYLQQKETHNESV